VRVDFVQNDGESHAFPICPWCWLPLLGCYLVHSTGKRRVAEMSKQVTSSVRDTAAAADGRKLAEVTAEQIEREIAEAGWPVGEVLGSEPEMLERLGTSRAVFRARV